MYDPFATPQAAAPPVTAPTTATADPNNALAAIANRIRGNGQIMPFQMGPFQQARMDWRSQRPAFDASAGPPPEDWRQQMIDWRSQRPRFADYRMAPAPGA